jgi:hypothetical protein
VHHSGVGAGSGGLLVPVVPSPAGSGSALRSSLLPTLTELQTLMTLSPSSNALSLHPTNHGVTADDSCLPTRTFTDGAPRPRPAPRRVCGLCMLRLYYNLPDNDYTSTGDVDSPRGRFRVHIQNLL